MVLNLLIKNKNPNIMWHRWLKFWRLWRSVPILYQLVVYSHLAFRRRRVYIVIIVLSCPFLRVISLHNQQITNVNSLMAQSSFNPLTAKLFNLNFHSLEVVSRWRDPQLQVSENHSDLTKWRPYTPSTCRTVMMISNLKIDVDLYSLYINISSL